LYNGLTDLRSIIDTYIECITAKKKLRKSSKKKSGTVSAMRGCLTVIAELCGIAGFLLALFIFFKEYL